MAFILQHLCLLLLTLPFALTEFRLPYCRSYKTIEGSIRCTSCMPGYKLTENKCFPCYEDGCDKNDYGFGGTKNT